MSVFQKNVNVSVNFKKLDSQFNKSFGMIFILNKLC